MVVEKIVSNDGVSTTWRVPAWFVSVCVAIAILWVTWISGGMVYTMGELNKGERNTKAEGTARDVLITAQARQLGRLHTTLSSLEIPPPWFADLVHNNARHIESNRMLINECLVELKTLTKSHSNSENNKNH